MLAEQDECMKAAKEELEKINSDEAMRYAYLKEEMRVADEVTLRHYYEDKAVKERKEGIKEGIQEGLKKGEARFEKLCMGLLKDDRKEDLERCEQ